MAWRGRKTALRQPGDSSLPNIDVDQDMVVEDVEILFDEELGHGAYGVVYVGLWGGTPVAVKRAHSALVNDQVGNEQRNAFLATFSQEWRMFGHLRHPFIVQFLGVYQPRSRSPSMVMEYMDQALRERCQRTPYFDNDVTIRLCGEVLCALIYLHARGIVHRDLTTNNVLLTPGSMPTAKISDLGVARALFGDDPRRRLLLSQSRGMTRGPGAILYMSPESTDDSGRPYDTKHDIFSFGVLALSTSVRHEPTCFDEPRRVPLGDESGNFHVVPEVDRRRADLRDLPAAHPLDSVIRQCLRDAPYDRPTARDLLAQLERLPSTRSASSSRSETGQTEQLQVLRSEVAQLQQALATSQEAEHLLRDALQASEQRLRESADRERVAQEQVERLQRQLDVANERSRLANERARTAVEECEQSRSTLEEVLSQVRARALTSRQWKSLKDIPGLGKICHHSVHFGEWMVLIGGFDGDHEYCKRVYAYSVARRFWTEWARTPNISPQAASDGQRLYTLGGKFNRGLHGDVAVGSRSFYRISGNKREWVEMPDMLEDICDLDGVAVCYKHKLYVFGSVPNGHSYHLQVFDFAMHSWSSSTCYPGQLNCSVLVPWQDFLVSGSQDCYDIAANKWHPLSRRKAGRTRALAVFGDRIIAVGTATSRSSEEHACAVDDLESIQSNWSSGALPRLPSKRVCASACVVNDRLFVSGGYDAKNSLLCIF